MTRRILIATSNPGKLREIRAMTAGLSLEWCGLADLPPMPEAVEDQDTFEANAAKKALHYAGSADLWTVADDSGLVVDALDGAPGVHSARYSGARDDRANNRKLISALSGVSSEQRTARFVCCAVLARPGGVLATARGTIEGRIIDEPRGSNGFGYDPHFWLPDKNATAAELPQDEKNRISHRGQAIRLLLEQLQAILSGARREA